jgi:CubicO group peptidase (beta-lactamase class C family)
MMAVSGRDAMRQRIDRVIDEALADKLLVGMVVLVAQGGDSLYRRAAGWADRDNARPMRADTLFRYSSLTKPIVTAAAMALIEQGQLRLDDTVDRWLPEFRPSLPDDGATTITLRQLLTHTSGLSYGFFHPAGSPYDQARVSDGLDQPGLSMTEELRRLGSVPLRCRPGSAWEYSLSLDVAGAILAEAAGEPLPQLVERLVCGPLGMTDTAFSVRAPNRLAVPYVPTDPPRPMNDPDLVPMDDTLPGIRFSPSRVFDPASFPSGGAGMVGSAGDLLTFLETIRSGGGPILSADTTKAMMENQIGDLRINVEETPSWGFGFGGAVLIDQALAGVPQSTGTWKWGGVYGHHWYVDRKRELTVVALSNTAVAGMTGSFQSDLMRAVYGFRSPS